MNGLALSLLGSLLVLCAETSWAQPACDAILGLAKDKVHVESDTAFDLSALRYYESHNFAEQYRRVKIDGESTKSSSRAVGEGHGETGNTVEHSKGKGSWEKRNQSNNDLTTLDSQEIRYNSRYRYMADHGMEILANAWLSCVTNNIPLEVKEAIQDSDGEHCIVTVSFPGGDGRVGILDVHSFGCTQETAGMLWWKKSPLAKGVLVGRAGVSARFKRQKGHPNPVVIVHAENGFGLVALTPFKPITLPAQPNVGFIKLQLAPVEKSDAQPIRKEDKVKVRVINIPPLVGAPNKSLEIHGFQSHRRVTVPWRVAITNDWMVWLEIGQDNNPPLLDEPKTYNTNGTPAAYVYENRRILLADLGVNRKLLPNAKLSLDPESSPSQGTLEYFETNWPNEEKVLLKNAGEKCMIRGTAYLGAKRCEIEIVDGEYKFVVEDRQ